MQTQNKLLVKSKSSAKLTMKSRNALIGLAFVSIWIVGFCVFTLYPMFYTGFLSFNEVKVTTNGIVTTFVGWQNFYRAFMIDDFINANLIKYVSEMIIYVPVIIVAGLIIAMLLNTKFKGVGIFRTIFFLPVIITSGPVVKQFLDQGVGTIGNIGELIDLTIMYDMMPEFLANSINFLLTQFIMILWFSGVQILIYLAGLKKLDNAMYEAAKIDGAGKWETFWKLTLPAINPMIIINVIYTVVAQSLFSLNPVVVKIAEELIKVDTGYGYSAALAFVYTGVIIVALGVFSALFYRWEKRPKKMAEY